MTRLTTRQACDLLYRGKSNVPNAARMCDLPKEELFRVFSEYAKAIPIDEDDWRSDVEPGWPYVT